MSFGSHILLRRRQMTHVMLCFDLKNYTNDLRGEVILLGDVQKEVVRDLSIRLGFSSEAWGHTGFTADNFSILSQLYTIPFVSLVRAEQEVGIGSEGAEQVDTAEDGVSGDVDLGAISNRILNVDLRGKLLTEVFEHIQGSADNIKMRATLKDQLEQIEIEVLVALPDPVAVILYRTRTVLYDLKHRTTLGIVAITALNMPVGFINPLIVHHYESVDVGPEMTSESTLNLPVVILVMNFDQNITDMTLTEGEREEATPGTSSAGSLSGVTPTEIGVTNKHDTEIESTVTAPLAATTISLDNVTEFVIDISWPEITDPNIIGYNVYANGVKQNESPVTDLFYSLTNLEQEVVYDIWVKSTYPEEWKEGPRSNTLSEHLVDIVSPAIDDNMLTVEAVDGSLTNEISISFQKAVDGLTNSTNLVYRLYRSSYPDLDTDPATVEANGSLVDTATDVNQFIVANVTQADYFNITVEDEAGNKNLYQQQIYDIALEPGAELDGGNPEYYEDGGEYFALHTYTASGDIDILQGGTVEFLLIAGGGSGHRGGGGAGGAILSKATLESGLIPITIGVGGSGESNGEDSTFLSRTAIGGGEGGFGGAGQDGGSGGGGGYGTGGNHPGGQGTENQGNDGGLGDGFDAGGGGGGYSSAGTNGHGTGNGGDGIEYPAGSGIYHAGGGGGYAVGGGSGVGDNGLGGDVENYGGGGHGNSSTPGSPGGPGVLFIRYPVVVESIITTPIPDQQVDGELQLDLDNYFDHDFPLEYSATSNDSSIASVSVNGNILTIIGESVDTTSITVTATVEGTSETAQQSFDATVQSVNQYHLYLDGTDDYIEFPRQELGFPLTLEAKVVFHDLSSVQHIIGTIRPRDFLYAGATLRHNGNGDLQLFLGNAGGYSSFNRRHINCAVSLSPGVEYHISAVALGTSDMNIYLDGTLLSGGVYGGSAGGIGYGSRDNPGVIGINHMGNNGQRYANTNVRDCRIWSVGRTQSEIQNNLGGVTGNETGLEVYFPVDEGSGTTLNDNTGNGNDGTIVGATWSR